MHQNWLHTIFCLARRDDGDYMTFDELDWPILSPPRLLICGDREWGWQQRNPSSPPHTLPQEGIVRKLKEQSLVEDLTYCLAEAFPDGILIAGHAKGADTIAEMSALKRCIPTFIFPANWEGHGKAAGPIRNRAMLKLGMPNIVVGFHANIAQSKGTRDMLNISKKSGIPTYLASLDDVVRY